MTRPSEGPAGDNLPGGGFLFNVNLVFISTVVSYGLSFFVAVLMARSLGDDGLGVTALYRSAITLGFAFFSLGIAVAIFYYIGRRDISPRDGVEAGLSVTLFATAMTAIGVLIAALLFNDELSRRHVPYWLALVGVPAAIQFRVVESALRAQGRFGAMNIMEVSSPLCVLFCLGAVELAVGLTVQRTVVVWTLALLPPVALGYAMLGPSQWPRRLAGRALLERSIRFGVQGQLSNLVQLLNLRLDSYLVLLLVNAAGVGLYAVGVSLSEGMWFIANSVGVVLLTHLTAGDEETAKSMTPVVCRNTLLVTGAGAFVAAAVSPFVIPAVFGHQFEGSVLPFVWLLPGTVALAGTKILAAYVFSRGKPMINAQIAAITLAVTIAADLVLIPAFEVSGAAAGASLAYCVSLALTAIAYRRLSGLSIAGVLLPTTADLPLYVDGLRSLAGRLPLAGRAAGGGA
jgi:O-antigen/teichoic acid export membrane protein